MATASEILATETGLNNVWFEVDLLSRQIIIPKAVTNLGVKGDKDVMHVRFKLPRFFYDVDFSEFKIGIDYTNAEGEEDRYEPKDVTVGVSVVTFTWVVGRHAALYEGTVKFGLCAKRLNPVDPDDPNNEFHTTKTSLPILDGMETCEQAIVMHTDLLEQWREQLFGEKDSLIATITEAAQAERNAIKNKGAEVLATIPEDYQTTFKMIDNADRTKSDAIVSTVEGEIITVADSSDDYLRGLRVFGKTTQVKTTGKNLIDPNKYILDTSGTTLNDDVFTLTSINGALYLNTGYSGNPVTHPAGTYTLSIVPVSNNAKVAAVIYSKATGTILKSHAATAVNGYDLTFTIDEEFYIAIGGGSSDMYGTHSFKLQLELGEVATAYEPYSGGFASPSPEWSQPLVSIENPTIHVYGKNLFDASKLLAASGWTETDGVYSGMASSIDDMYSSANGVPLVSGFKERTQYVLSFYCRVDNDVDKTAVTFSFKYSDGTSSGVYPGSVTGKREQLISTPGKTVVALYGSYGNNLKTYLRDIQLEEGYTVTDYEPYSGGNVDLHHSLPAIPVSKDGNYTDENGQQWICDEIDFGREVHIQRVGTIVYDGSADEAWLLTGKQYHIAIKDKRNNYVQVPNGLLCSHFKVYPTVNTDKGYISETHYHNGNINILINMDDGVGGLDNFVAWLQSNPMTVYYVLATPIETPLTQEEIQWFRFAHTNFPNTTVLNDAGATMQLEYNVDTKMYLDNVQKPTDDQVQASVDAWLTAHYASAEGASF